MQYFLLSIRGASFILGNMHALSEILSPHVLYISTEKRITAWEADFTQSSASAHNLRTHTRTLSEAPNTHVPLSLFSQEEVIGPETLGKQLVVKRTRESCVEATTFRPVVFLRNSLKLLYPSLSCRRNFWPTKMSMCSHSCH